MEPTGKREPLSLPDLWLFFMFTFGHLNIQVRQVAILCIICTQAVGVNVWTKKPEEDR